MLIVNLFNAIIFSKSRIFLGFKYSARRKATFSAHPLQMEFIKKYTYYKNFIIAQGLYKAKKSKKPRLTNAKIFALYLASTS